MMQYSINTYHVFQSTIKISDTFKADTYSPVVYIYLKGFLKYSVIISVSVIKKLLKYVGKMLYVAVHCNQIKLFCYNLKNKSSNYYLYSSVFILVK